MTGSPGDDDALDGALTRGARLAFPRIDPMKVLEFAGVAVGIHVVAEGTAAAADGAAEDLFHAAREPADAIERQVAAAGERVNARREERFVDVNVAEAGDEVLVEQCGLDRAAGLRQAAKELGRGDRERVRGR